MAGLNSEPAAAGGRRKARRRPAPQRARHLGARRRRQAMESLHVHQVADGDHRRPVKRSDSAGSQADRLGVRTGRGDQAAREPGPAAQANDYIFGYTLENDVSDRGGRGDNRYGSDWLIAKSHDTFAPMGPFIVPKEFVADPRKLPVRFVLNGQLMQSADTSLMIHNVFEQVSYGSRIMTLRPGDVIATGSPAGVGSARKPPIFFKPGDTAVCTYQGCRNSQQPRGRALAGRQPLSRSLIVIYQKPTCTTCRQVYAALKESGVDFATVDYYVEPIPQDKLVELLGKMNMRAIDLVRTKEPIYKTLKIRDSNLTDDQIVELMVRYPDLIQRPIVENGSRAILARPAERLKEIL